MRVPFRLNRSGWPSHLLPRRASLPDPRALLSPDALAAPQAFVEHVSVLRLGSTYKTTKPGRHRLSDALLARVLSPASPVIVDVGASDGSTALDLMNALKGHFSAYYVTDLAVSLRVRVDERERTCFYDSTGECVLIATPRWVIYPDVPEAGAFLQSWLRRLRRSLPPFDAALPEVSLIQPRLVEMAIRDPRVKIQAYDVFQRWVGPTPTVIKVANLLNRVYFSDREIRLALSNLREALGDGGLLLIVDNREIEKASLFARTSGGFRLVESIHGGTEIADLVA